MTEHTFARKLTAGLRKRGAYVWKINANFAGGIPDMWVAGPAGDLWIELKWRPSLPTRDSTRVTPALSAQQLEWLIARHLQGVRVMVLLATEAGCLIFKHPVEWREGSDAGTARARLMTHMEVLYQVGRVIGLHEGPEDERRQPFADNGRTRGNRRPAESTLDQTQRRSGPNPDDRRREIGDHPRQLHAVPQPAHSDKHRFCAESVQAA